MPSFEQTESIKSATPDNNANSERTGEIAKQSINLASIQFSDSKEFSGYELSQSLKKLSSVTRKWGVNLKRVFASDSPHATFEGTAPSLFSVINKAGSVACLLLAASSVSAAPAMAVFYSVLAVGLYSIGHFLKNVSKINGNSIDTIVAGRESHVSMYELRSNFKDPLGVMSADPEQRNCKEIVAKYLAATWKAMHETDKSSVSPENFIKALTRIWWAQEFVESMPFDLFPLVPIEKREEALEHATVLELASEAATAGHRFAVNNFDEYLDEFSSKIREINAL